MSKTKSSAALLALSYIAFISLGLPDGLLGVAWPSMHQGFGIPLDSLGALLIALMAGYLTSSFFSGALIARWGLGNLLAVSCAATGLSLLGFTVAPNWWSMLALGVVSGMGGGAVDAALNTFAADQFDKKAMQWLHAFYGVGVMIGPVIMTVGLSRFQSWRWGYVLVGGAIFVLTLCFLATLKLWERKARGKRKAITSYKTKLSDSLSEPGVWLSFMLFFIYTGVESSLGNWSYTLLTESRGISAPVAGLWCSGYWAAFTLGRIAAGIYAQRISTQRLIRLSLGLTLAAASLYVWNPSPRSGLLALLLLGWAIAPIFASLMSGTTERVGSKHAANTIGLQISAMGLGTAILPGLIGLMAARFGLEAIPRSMGVLVLLLCFVYWLASPRKSASKRSKFSRLPSTT